LLPHNSRFFNAFFLLGMSKSLGLMILLAHLKFCWPILNFAGAGFLRHKSHQQKTPASKTLLARQKIPSLQKSAVKKVSRYKSKTAYGTKHPFQGLTTLTPNFSSCHPISKLKNVHSMEEGFGEKVGTSVKPHSVLMKNPNGLLDSILSIHP
jgi:hypothetical protein